MIVFPTFLLVYFIRPTTTRFFCLLKNAIQKDNDMIAVVVHSMDKVRVAPYHEYAFSVTPSPYCIEHSKSAQFIRPSSGHCTAQSN